MLITGLLVSQFHSYLCVSLCTEGGGNPANFISQDPLPSGLHFDPANGSTVRGQGSRRARRSLFLKASPVAQRVAAPRNVTASAVAETSAT